MVINLCARITHPSGFHSVPDLVFGFLFLFCALDNVVTGDIRTCEPSLISRVFKDRLSTRFWLLHSWYMDSAFWLTVFLQLCSHGRLSFLPGSPPHPLNCSFHYTNVSTKENTCKHYCLPQVASPRSWSVFCPSCFCLRPIKWLFFVEWLLVVLHLDPKTTHFPTEHSVWPGYKPWVHAVLRQVGI